MRIVHMYVTEYLLCIGKIMIGKVINCAWEILQAKVFMIITLVKIYTHSLP